MKNKFRVGMALIALLGSSVWAAPAKVDVTVKGMVCSFCAQGITKKFKSRPEVEAVKVVLKDQKVYLTLKDGRDIPDKEITALLRQAGYSVDKIERIPG